MTPSDFETRLGAFEMGSEKPPFSIPKEQKWMGVSQLQKAIRRGLPDQAEGWARALWDADRSYGLFRMAVIAAEEVAGGDPALAARYLESEIRRDWFNERGGVKAMAFFAREFALAVKDRSSCDLAGLSKRAGSAPTDLQGSWEQADRFAKDSDSLAALALDAGIDPRARHRALWLLAGTQRVPAPADMIPSTEGDYPYFLSVCERLCPDSDLDTVIRKSFNLNKEPNPIGLALCRSLALSEGSSVSPAPLRVPTAVEGHWNLAGVDMHTREGQAAIGNWLKGSAPLKRLMGPVSAWRDKTSLLGYLVFRLEGHDVTPKLTYPTAERIQAWCQTGLSAAIGREDPEPVFRGLAMLLPGLHEQRKISCGLILAPDPRDAAPRAPSQPGKGSFKPSL